MTSAPPAVIAAPKTPSPPPPEKTVISEISRFLLPLLSTPQSPRPFVLGISGPQGSGKSTAVAELSTLLSAPPHNLRVVVLSIDDLYHPFPVLQDLARKNRLWRTRGLPGTHDVPLGVHVLRKLKRREGKVGIPRFDKSCHKGRGDRVDEAEWEVVDAEKVDVVLFEGWCVGFRALAGRQEETMRQAVEKWGDGLREVDKALEEYEQLWSMMEHLIHIDAQDINFVYDWRLEQEHWTIQQKGMGMNDDEVHAFVDGYMPGYELYGQALKEGALKGKGQKQLRITVDKERNVVEVEDIENGGNA